MKRIAFTLVLILVISSLIGCSGIQSSSKNEKNMPQPKKSTIPFNIINSSLTKSFDAIEQNIGVKVNNDRYEIRISPGPVFCSSFEVEKLELDNNTLTATLLVNNDSKDQESQVYNPVIILDIDRDVIENLQPENIKLINKNFKPLHISVNKKQAVSFSLNQLNLREYAQPLCDILLIKDQPAWHITFNSAVEVNSNNIVKAIVTTDASSEKLIENEISVVGEPISKGNMLSISKDDSRLLITNKDPFSGAYEMSSLNLKQLQEKTLYYTYSSIVEGHYSPDNQKIALTETSFDQHSLKIIAQDGKKLNSITTTDQGFLGSIRWVNNNELYYLKTLADNSTIYKLNTTDGSISPKFSSSGIIESFEILDKNTLIITTVVSSSQKDLYVLDLSTGTRTLVDTGQSPAVLTSSQFVYANSGDTTADSALYDIKLYDSQSSTASDLYINKYLYSYGTISKDSVYFITSKAPTFGYILTFASLQNPQESVRKYIPVSKAFIDRSGSLAYIQDSDSHYKQTDNIIYKFYLK